MEQKIIIAKLKDAKDRKGYTVHRIAEETEKMGEPINERTIKRVFSQSSTDKSFRLTTLFVIAKVLDVNMGGESEALADQLQTELIAAKDLIQKQDEQISSMRKRIEEYEHRIKACHRKIKINDWHLLTASLLACCLLISLIIKKAPQL